MKNPLHAIPVSIENHLAIAAVLLSVTLFSVLPSHLSYAEEPLSIVAITPSGEDVENTSQIVIRFNRAVVPIGRMERSSEEVGITIDPELKGRWRWITQTDLAFNIDAATGIKPSTKYTISISRTIKSQDGESIGVPVVHTFTTVRPSVAYYQFSGWRSLSTPVITLNFNQEVTRDSVQQHIYFSLPDNPSYRNGITVIDRKKKKEENEFLKFALSWEIFPSAPLPPDSKIELFSEPGLHSALGDEQAAEKKSIAIFDTFPEFKFAGIRYYDLSGKEAIVMSPEDAASGKSGHIVDPRGYTELLFTVPVNYKEIKDHVIFTPDLAMGRKDYDPWANAYDSSGLNFQHTRGELYGVALPQYLKAWQQYTIIEKRPGIRDPFGRELSSPIDFTFYTDHRKSGFRILHRTGVLEKDIESEIPVAVTNLDSMTISYNTLSGEDENLPDEKEPVQKKSGEKELNEKKSEESSTHQSSSLPINDGKATSVSGKPEKAPSVKLEKRVTKSNLRVQDIAYFVPMNIRKMLNGRSGAVYGKVVSTSPATETGGDDSFFTVVSPWQIHAKIGHFNSLVWVTDLSTGEPVKGVRVTVHRDQMENLTRNSAPIAESTTDENGVAMLPGTVVIDPARESFRNWWEKGVPRLILKAVKKENTQENASAKKSESPQNGISSDSSADKRDMVAEAGNTADRSRISDSPDMDVAILPLTYEHDFSAPTWRVSNGDIVSDTEPQYAHIHVWGTTPQGIYKAGDTIDYKIYVRDQNNSTFIKPPLSGYKLTITDPAGKKVLEKKDITLSEFGALNGTYTVPVNGAIGWYRFYLSTTFLEREWAPLKVMVTDFTPSPFKVSTELNGDTFKPGDDLNIETSALLHSGGPYSDTTARVTVRLQEKIFQPDTPLTRGFTFFRAAGGKNWSPGKKPGITDDESEESEDEAQDGVAQDDVSVQDEGADQEEGEEESDESDSMELPSDVPEVLLGKISELDHKGVMKTDLKLESSSIGYGTLEVESAVQDERGRYVSAMKRARYIGRDIYVGIKSPQWVYEAGKPYMMQAVAVDGAGRAVEGREIDIEIQHRVTRAARIKGAGNAYLMQYVNEWVTSEVKSLMSGSEPTEFEFHPTEPGDYRVLAGVGNPDKLHISSISTWVTGKGSVLWQAPDDYSLSVIPEKSSYKAGETARYLVKNPFPGAYALVSVERYGILKKWVQRLENSTQVIEVPVTKEDLPGFFLSVTVISPRVEAPPPDGDVDLGKPTFRMGYAITSVTQDNHDIKLQVEPEKQTYRPGDKIKVLIRASEVKPLMALADTSLSEKAGNGAGDGENTDKTSASEAENNGDADREKRVRKIELAVVVLDEAVFDLISSGRDYFDIYKGFHTLDGLDLENFSLLTNIVGRRKFEKKGANAGGDGGAGMKIRSSFKYVGYWNPSLVTDADGNAEIEFTAPDNLTGWKIFVIAVTPSDSMGLGEGSFKVNRPTEIRPVMPNQVTEGDSFRAGFSIMNRSEAGRVLDVSIKVNGEKLSGTTGNGISEKVELDPFKRKTIYLPVKTDVKGELQFTATAGDERDRDSIIYRLTVNSRRSSITVLTHGMLNDNEAVSEKLQYPEKIYTDSGETRVTFYPTVMGNMEDAFRYMESYPYGCWEQKISKAVMASHFIQLKKYLPENLTWSEAGKLPSMALQEASAYQAPNGGMAYFRPENSYVSPYLSAYTALAFGWLKAGGYSVPENVESRLADYLKNFLRKTPASTEENSFNSAGTNSTVRAVALAALSMKEKLKLQDISRYAQHIEEMSLFGKAHFLIAASGVKGAESACKKVWGVILQQSNLSGGKVVFNESLDSEFDHILESPLRRDGAILSAIISYYKTIKDEKTAKQLRDISFRLVRTITDERGSRKSGENTQENIFCMKGLSDYSALFEKKFQSPIETEAVLKGEGAGELLMGKALFTDLNERSATFSKPITEDDPGRKAELTITGKRADNTEKKLEIDKKDKKGGSKEKESGVIYYSAGMVYAPADEMQQSENSGMEIRREYSVERGGKWTLMKKSDETGPDRPDSNKSDSVQSGPDKSGSEKPQKTINSENIVRPGDILRPGDIVRVDLFLSLPAERHFPVIRDHVPGGLEPVNRDLATASIVDAEKADLLPPEGSIWYSMKGWHEFNESRWSFYHQEIGHSEVRYYADYLPAGNYHLSYTAQVVAEGRFTALPARAEEMYNADIFGRSSADVITVSDRASE